MGLTDNNSILDAEISERGAHGQRDLIPTGTYMDCEVADLEEMQLDEEDKKMGKIARLKVTFVCPGKDNFRILRYVNIKEGKLSNPHPMSFHFQIMAALWPTVTDRVGKSFRDWIGEKCTLSVFHVTNEKGQLTEEVKYTPVE